MYDLKYLKNNYYDLTYTNLSAKQTGICIPLQVHDAGGSVAHNSKLVSIDFLC